MTINRDTTVSWLVLIHHFPQDPGSLRVKIWRRLQSIGAVAIKNGMYVLPVGEQTLEDFQWVLREITAGGADGAVLEARFIDGMSDPQVRGLFDAARDTDYATLAEEIRQFHDALPGNRPLESEERRDLRSQLARFRKKLTEIEAIDFFAANGRDTVSELIAGLASRAGSTTKGGRHVQPTELNDLKGHTWVTRRNVHVDRIASAWLVRRWIDPRAVFKFTSDKKYAPREREVRFDMFEAEFTHEGDRCTFEVLLSQAGLDDPMLRRIAEIVHDIDLKDKKYDREETPGIAQLISGIVAGTDDDARRLERGGAMLDDLYRSFENKR